MRQTFAAIASCLAFATPVMADGPVVIELFTSQGCSSCPPADELLHELAARPDVIALALHVDYWDYIGWEDVFADPAFTRRQQQYAQVAGSNTIYTPQLVVGGQDHVIGAKPMDVADAIQAHRSAPNGVRVTLLRSGDQLQITGTAPQAFPQAVLVQMVRFIPEQTVDIHRGENQGQSISYANIVTEWVTVGDWTGQGELDMTVDMSGTGGTAVIVQEQGPGAVLASAILN